MNEKWNVLLCPILEANVYNSIASISSSNNKIKYPVLGLPGEASQKSIPQGEVSLFSPKYSQYHLVCDIVYIISTLSFADSRKSISSH